MSDDLDFHDVSMQELMTVVYDVVAEREENSNNKSETEDKTAMAPPQEQIGDAAEDEVDQPQPLNPTETVVNPTEVIGALRLRGVTADASILEGLIGVHGADVDAIVREIDQQRAKRPDIRRYDATACALVVEGYRASKGEICYLLEAYKGDVDAVRAQLNAAAATPQTVQAKPCYDQQADDILARGEYRIERARVLRLLEAFEGNTVEVEKVLKEVTARRGQQQQQQQASASESTAESGVQAKCACLGASSGYHRAGCPAAQPAS
eukprot:PhM_4_TR2940/c0_g1_i1/m.61910